MTASKYAKERKAFGKQIGEFGLMKEKLAEMAVRIFAVDSMIYRTAGNIEAAMIAASGGGNKAQNTMKVLEEYSIESSIAKVYGSEMLDYCGGRGGADIWRLRLSSRIIPFAAPTAIRASTASLKAPTRSTAC